MNCLFYQKVEFTESEDFGDSDSISVIATRKIKIGEEFIVNYGDDFDYSIMDTQIITLKNTPEKTPKKRETIDVEEFISTQFSQSNLSQSFNQNSSMDLDFSNILDENFTETDKAVDDSTQNVGALTAVTQDSKEEEEK